ncbi:MAG TPA: GrpB family protein [Actinoplanes sp.]
MSDERPVWADEKPELVAHDPAWLELGATHQARLAELLAPWLVAGVEHIGSTAVPGLPAKPIVDLMASVRDLEAAVDGAAGRLAEHGWCYVPPALDLWPWRRFFVLPDAAGQRRLAHLHLIAAGHSRWHEQLNFRDALRRDLALAQRYADAKRLLAAEHPDDREAYTEGKADFLARERITPPR